jgi:ATP-dependent Clp protease ATP-binding subunit ClpA
MLSRVVEKVVERALKSAQERRQEFATVEHLCCALFDEMKIVSLLSQIGVNKRELKERFLNFIDTQIEGLPLGSVVETMPSLGFQRVLQRAAVHIVGAGKEEVSVEHVLVAAFDEDESHAVFMMQQAGLTRLDLVTVISHGGYSFEEEDEEEFGEQDISNEHGQKEQGQTALERFTICLTDEAKKGRLDLLIGRESELLRAIQVLSRRRKNNPLFVGEPGVGKTALAEGLALRIIDLQVPKHLQGAEMYQLDIGAMLAGARYRGDFENRMKSVLKAIESKNNAIMVIDEIHTVIGAGSTVGSSMDASNLLKPILSKGKVRCIGSTTYKEYRTYFEKDRALARRFQKIDIEEPSEEDCKAILMGIKKQYEDFHNLTISDEAINLAVSLAKRFLHERKLPDIAIDLIDEACARQRLSLENHSDTLEESVRNVVVDKLAIEEAVASMAHIPSRNINRDDKESLRKLEDSLREVVFGQETAIEQIANAILMSRAGLREKEKPIGSFLFTGPSGVGKTEVARQLAYALNIELIRFDMSEYMERHTASRLVGAPPGYVGYDQGGLLTDAINKTPHAVLLLDEIEKAHPDVFNMLLQVMDYGKLTDSNGRTSDFRHVILIMTSNVGARELEQRSIGFLDEVKNTKDDKAVKRLFSPEFRNRLDGRINFNKLSPDIVIKVVDKFMKELEAQLKEKNVAIEISIPAKKLLADQGYDVTMGARPLSRLIQDQIKKPLAHELLFGRIANGGIVDIDVKNGVLELSYRELDP